MMKEVVRALETGILPQIGLMAFLLAFVLVLIYAFTISKTQCSILKGIPLEDEQDIIGSAP